VVHHDVNSFGDGLNQSQVLYDGLGRQVENRQYVDADTCPSGGFVSVQKQYDALGRVWTVSNPFCATASSDSPPASSLTTTAYDALGRVLSVTTPDGAQTKTTYAGNVTTTTDPASNSRALTTDAFGRTIQVVESGKDANPSYTTVYKYDALNDLICVNQSGQYRVFNYDSMGRLILADNPETRVQAISSCTAGSPAVTYAYDNANNLIGKTDTGGYTFTYVPDALNRVSSKTTHDGTTQYFFDQNLSIPKQSAPNYPVGRLSSVTFGTVTQTYRYDAVGRYQSSEQTVGGQPNPFVFHYNYVPAGLASMQYPSGRTVTTTYDAAGRPNGVAGYASGITYAPHGAMSGVSFANGVQESWSFNSRLQPACLTAGVGTAPSLLQLTNIYTAASAGGSPCGLSGTDNNGNVVSQTIGIGPASFTLNYGYADGLNRVTSAGETNTNGTYSGLGWSQGFNYNDAWGNRTLASSTLPVAWSHPASFDTENHVKSAGWSYSADHRGNLASTPEMSSMTYDAESRLQTAVGPYGTTTFVYDGDGRRVMATSGATATVYVYDAMGQLAAEYGGTATGNGTQYLTADHLGSTRLVTGAAGAVLERHDYAPFGEEISAQGCNQTAASGERSPRCDIAGYGTASEVPLLFTGKERDGNTGLDYFGARYFSGAQGRYTSPDDPLNDQNPADPQSWNLYSYVRNNPLRFTDPDGRKCITLDNGTKADDGTGGGCEAAGVSASGNIKAQQVTVQDFEPPSALLLAVAQGVQRAGPVVNAAGYATMGVMTGAGAGVLYGAITGGTGLITLGIASGPLVGFGLTPEAQAWAEEMIAEGHQVVALPTNSVNKMADFVVDGVTTEYKGLTGSGATTVKNAIEKAAQQGKDIVIDARRVAISAQNALQQIQRAQGNVGGLQGRVTVLTKDGPVKF
jgi:RHS repeat-associated protein